MHRRDLLERILVHGNNFIDFPFLSILFQVKISENHSKTNSIITRFLDCNSHSSTVRCHIGFMPIWWTQVFTWPMTVFHVQQRPSRETRPSTLGPNPSPSSNLIAPSSQTTSQPSPLPLPLTKMSLSPSPFQDQLDARDETQAEPLNTKNDRPPSPTPNDDQASQPSLQNERNPSSTPTSAQVPSIENGMQNPSAEPHPHHSSLPNTSPSTPMPSSETVTSPFAPNMDNSPHGIMRQTNTEHDDRFPSLAPTPKKQQQPQQMEAFDPSEPLADYDWDDLEARFQAKMAECSKVEEGIEAEFQELISVRSLFLSFSSFCSIQEVIVWSN